MIPSKVYAILVPVVFGFGILIGSLISKERLKAGFGMMYLALACYLLVNIQPLVKAGASGEELWLVFYFFGGFAAMYSIRARVKTEDILGRGIMLMLSVVLFAIGVWSSFVAMLKLCYRQ